MPVPVSACLNCGSALTGAYCASCGQKATRPEPSLREFLHETTQELTHWDGKLATTLATLFGRPGILTRDFLNGRRARWLAPMRVYLICSLAFFAARSFVEVVGLRTPRQIARVTLGDSTGPTSLTPELREEIAQGLPARLWGVERVERAAADPARLNREVEAALSKGMFLLLPVFALLTMFAWRARHRHYPAHLYVALHLHAVLFGALTVMTLALGLVPSERIAELMVVPFLGYIGWYGLTALRRIFAESWPLTILKTLLVTVAYLACLLATSLAIVGYAVSRL
jgi:hypothetical protein